MTDANPILAEVLRGARVECLHRGAVAIVRDGELIFGAGDVDRAQFLRSAAKPFQALAALEMLAAAGAAEPTGPEVALMAASHGGRPEQVAVVRGLLSRAGVEVSALRCGTHTPYDATAAAELVRAGRKPEPLHHNCSGKHAGMLVAAKALGASLDDYLAPTHPVQRASRATLARFAGVAAEDVGVEVDGCGAPTFVLSTRRAATAFARFGASTEPLVRRIREAVAADPVLYAGPGRTCTKLATAAPGRIFPKAGAEGFYALALPHEGIGVASKIDDGSHRPTEPLLATLLLRHATWEPAARAALEALASVVLKNASGAAVGAVRIVP